MVMVKPKLKPAMHRNSIRNISTVMWDEPLYTAQAIATKRIIIWIIFLAKRFIIPVLMNIDRADTVENTISRWASIGFPHCQIAETEESAKKRTLKRCTPILPEEKDFPMFGFSAIGQYLRNIGIIVQHLRIHFGITGEHIRYLRFIRR